MIVLFPTLVRSVLRIVLASFVAFKAMYLVSLPRSIPGALSIRHDRSFGKFVSLSEWVRGWGNKLCCGEGGSDMG